jgi:hypothetical protein
LVFTNNKRVQKKQEQMQGLFAESPPPLGDDLPVFSDPDLSYFGCFYRVIGKLRHMSTWTTAVAKAMLQDPTFVITEELRNTMRRAFWNNWVKYWVWQSAFVNEYKYEDLPALPTSTPEELTADGLRHVRSSLAMYYLPEIARFYFLAEFGSPRYLQWSLASSCTQNDWWIEHWSELECAPESLDAPSKAMEALREENARKKRLEEEQGPVNMDAVETRQETPEQAFRKVFQSVTAAAASSASTSCFSVPAPAPAAAGSGFGSGSGKLWFRPVCQYTQRNVYDAVMLLCERIQDYPYHQDIVTLIELLVARVGVLFLQPGKENLFDIPRYREQITEDGFYRANRAFMAWASAYFYELLQRVYYQRTIRLRVESIQVLQTQADALKTALLRFCEDMGPSTFMSMYRLCVEENYKFPGDDTFSRFLHPEGRMNLSDTLLELRSERQAPRFFSEDTIDAKTILQNMLAAETHIARLCVWNVLDWYLNMEVGIRFRDAVVIDQCGIQMSRTKLVDSSVPCIVTLFSRPIVHHNFTYYESDDVYQVVIKWLLLIRHQKDGFLFRTDISRQIAALLGEQQQGNNVVAPNSSRQGPKDDYEEVPNMLVDRYNNVVRPL